MYFKGTIVITDPCYVIDKDNYPHPKPEDFNLSQNICSKPFSEYKTPDELAYKAACDKYYAEFDEKDDWRRCNCGENMEVLGFHKYFTRDTLIGDWSCTTYKLHGADPETYANMIAYYLNNDEYEPYLGEKIGDFCADSGQVSVFLLDEILKYNPNWTKWAEEHSWCATIIKDFDGEVKCTCDKSIRYAHIIGEGNINFYTI